MFTTRVQGTKSHEVLWTAELLAAAADAEGRGAIVALTAPGRSLCAIDADAAAFSDPPSAADALIVQDPVELSGADTFAGLSTEAYLLVNSACGFSDLGIGERVARFCRDRTLILPVARLQIGSHDATTCGGGLLGGLAALTGAVSLESVISAIGRMAGSPAGECAEAAMAGYEFVRAEREALVA
jgi:pyruvate ferredoxin oxidoreductase gamma subunit